MVSEFLEYLINICQLTFLLPLTFYSIMNFNFILIKCKVLHLGGGGGELHAPVYAGKHLGRKNIRVDTKSSMSQQYVLAAKKADGILGCIRPRIVSLLVSSAQPHLQYCVQF